MRDLVSEFIDMKAVEEGAAINSLQAYRNDLKQYIEETSPQPIQDIKQEDIEIYLKKLKDKGALPKTISRKISTLREFYKFLQSENIIENNPSNKLHTPKIGKSLPTFLTPEEVEGLCDAAEVEDKYITIRNRVMIKLMYSSGLRVSELVSLPENAVNFDLKQILIFGKGSKERIIPVTKEVIDDICKYSTCRDIYLKGRKSKWLFPSERSLSGHITRDGFFKNLKAIAVRAGISPARVHPHVLRHTFATQLVNNNADLRSIQKMLGHENIVTTEIYTHVSTEKLVDEVKKKHPLAQMRGD